MCSLRLSQPRWPHPWPPAAHTGQSGYGEVATRKQVRLIEAHSMALHSLAYSPDGHILASGGREGLIKLWDPESGKLLLTLKTSDTSHNSPRGLSFSPDGRRLACVTQSGLVSLWSVSTGEQERTMSAGSSQPYVFALAFSRDGKWVVSGGGPGVLKFWDTATGPAPFIGQWSREDHRIARHQSRRSMVGCGRRRAITLSNMASGGLIVAKGHMWGRLPNLRAEWYSAQPAKPAVSAHRYSSRPS